MSAASSATDGAVKELIDAADDGRGNSPAHVVTAQAPRSGCQEVRPEAVDGGHAAEVVVERPGRIRWPAAGETGGQISVALDRSGGGCSSRTLGVVVGHELAVQHRQREPVADQVVGGQGQEVIELADAKQRGPDERKPARVDRLGGVGTRPLEGIGLSFLDGGAGGLHDTEAAGAGGAVAGQHHLLRQTVGVDGEDGAQRLVVAHQLLQPGLQSRHRDGPGETDGEGDDVRVRHSVELLGEPDPQLGGRQDARGHKGLTSPVMLVRGAGQGQRAAPMLWPGTTRCVRRSHGGPPAGYFRAVASRSGVDHTSDFGDHFTLHRRITRHLDPRTRRNESAAAILRPCLSLVVINLVTPRSGHTARKRRADLSGRPATSQSVLTAGRQAVARPWHSNSA